MNPHIEEIKNLIPTIKDSLNDIDVGLPSSSQTGSMDGSELKEALKAVISDINRLTQSNHLILYFTFQEIECISTSLKTLETAVPSRTYDMICCLDTLRPLVRSYWIRNRSKAETKQIQKCEEALTDLNEVISKKEEISNQAKALLQKIADTEEAHDNLKERIVQLESTKEEADQYAKEIADQKSNAEFETATIKAKRETIDAFTEKITTREKDLEGLKDNMNKHSQAIAEMKKLNDELLDVLDENIENSKKLLNLNNSIGLSREFQAKAENLKPKLGLSFTEEKWFRVIPKLKFSNNMLKCWLILSGIFIFMAVALASNLFGISPTLQNDPWDKISRLSMISLLVTSAVFCAKQYTKSERIREEYDYKKVISATLPSFLKELEDSNTSESKYLAWAIKELHKHPLDFLNRESEKKGKTKDSKLDEFTKVQS